MRLWRLVSGLVAANCLWPACIPLAPGQTQRAVGSSAAPPCYLVVVDSGEAAQLVLEQPQDLGLRLSGDLDFFVDGFDFGRETMTIDQAGSYRVRVERVAAGNGTFPVVLFRKAIPPQRAGLWRSAEEWATRSKASRRAEDISGSLNRWMELDDALSIARTHLKAGSAGLGADPLRVHVSLTGRRSPSARSWPIPVVRPRLPTTAESPRSERVTSPVRSAC
jgi:hypothetical protein